jgi:hypothetical protein
MTNPLYHVHEAGFTGFIVDHIEHLEDLPVLHGWHGACAATAYLTELVKMIEGSAIDPNFNLSLKYDGSFSIVAGYDPRDGKFFVAKKSIFNKQPVYFKSTQEIQNSDLSDDLKTKFVWSHMMLPSTFFGEGIFQGDFLYDATDLETMEIDGKKHICFQPNTIIYALPIPEQVDPCNLPFGTLGIAWHTSYSGTPDALLKSHERPFPASSVYHAKSIDADIKQIQNFGLNTAHFRRMLDSVNRDIDELGVTLDWMMNHPQLPKLFKQYQNDRSRALFRYSFEYWLNEYFMKEIQLRKSPKGKNDLCAIWDSIILFVKSEGWHRVRDLIWRLTNLKHLMLENLFQCEFGDFKTFYRYKNNEELHPTFHEGFVMSSTHSPAVKLVDRNEFSFLNRDPSVQHSWER